MYLASCPVTPSRHTAHAFDIFTILKSIDLLDFYNEYAWELLFLCAYIYYKNRFDSH
jgi:hypothetical protein